MSLTRSKKIKGLIKKAEKCLIVNDILTAEALSREIIKFDPKNAEAYYFLGEALCKHRRFEEAIRVLKQADELLPNHPRIIHLLGWTIFMNGDVDSGRKYLEFALKEIPNDIQILCDLAVLETHQGNGGKAKEYILKAWEIDQNHPLVQEVFKAVVTFDKAKSRLTKKAN